MAGNNKSIHIQYDQPFNPKEGQIYQFKDFVLEYNGVTEISPEDKKRRDKANQEGMDGGASMLTDSKIFKLTKLDHIFISNVEMQMTPYAWQSFDVNGKTFNIEYDNNGDAMIVRDGPLMRDRPFSAKYYESFNPYFDKGNRFPDFDIKFINIEKKAGKKIKTFFQVSKNDKKMVFEKSALPGASPATKFTFQKTVYILTSEQPVWDSSPEGYMAHWLYPEVPSADDLAKNPKLKTSQKKGPTNQKKFLEEEKRLLKLIENSPDPLHDLDEYIPKQDFQTTPELDIPPLPKKKK